MTSRILKLFISLCVRAFDRAFLSAAGLTGCGTKTPCIALCYHSVARDKIRRFEKQMDDLLRWAKPIPGETTDIGESGKRRVIVTFDDAFSGTLARVSPLLIARGIPFSVFVPAGFLGKPASWGSEMNSETPRETVLNREELRLLAEDPHVTIGSHGVNHENMTRLPAGEALYELTHSKYVLEEILGKAVSLFSFPYGEYDPTVHSGWAYEAGYRRLFTTSPVLALSEPGEFLTGRIDVDADNWPLEFRLKLLGAYRWLPLAFALKRKILRIFGGGYHASRGSGIRMENKP